MYRRRAFRVLAILAALTLGSTAPAVEPDGRVVFRYDWPDTMDGDSAAPRLRLSMTALVDLSQMRLSVTVPTGIDLDMRAAGRAPAPWPEEGLTIGELAAGETIVLELDVQKPSRGGGILGFVLRAKADGHLVHEGVGVPVGVPGKEPTLRNGAVEFPAEREDPAP